MPRLIHLNGPPAIGKSTLAQRYVDEHPGVLNLDIDRVRCLLGGWQSRFTESGKLVRPIALAMAATHLRAGHDVVMPQFLGRLEEIARFEAVAHDSGADFCEIVLMDDKESSLERFDRRGESDPLPWHGQVREIVAAHGGPELLAAMHDQLTEVLRARARALVVRTREGEIEEAYTQVGAALAGPG